jgi:type VI secretion system protein ImpG
VSDDLLAYYNKELSYLRHLGDEFGRSHPKIAKRLRLEAGQSDDPHVERLIEAFAYLSARLRHKLEDDLPEISDALLGILYPHYQAPIPSLAMVQFELDIGQSELTSGHTIQPGTMLETDAIPGQPCNFRTCYPVTLWPVDVVEASLRKPPFSAPLTRFSGEAAAVLRIVLRSRSQELKLAQLEMDHLRFFLKGQPQHVYPLYEILFKDTLAIVLAKSAADAEPVIMPRSCLQPVGFARGEGLLPYTARSFLGYRLLSEYFTFPEKFHFVDVTGLRGRIGLRAESQVEIFFYLSKWSKDLEQNVSAETFQMGCTPVVNLFSQRAEPIELNHSEWEYRVVPDRRRPLGMEIHSIDRVSAASPDGESVEYWPFYSTKHGFEAEDRKTFWFATRRAGEIAEFGGTDVYLSLVDLGLRPAAPADWTLSVETTCLNRDLPRQLPFGPDQPRFQFSEGQELVSNIRCLTPPTLTRRPALKHGALWRLISHLTLNHLSIVEDGQGAAALREVLKLYDFADSAETRALIDGIRAADSQRVTARVGEPGKAAVCRGVEVTLRFNAERFAGQGMYLFACVLERFLALYCSVNSFSKLVATVEGREGVWCRWPPRAGEKVLL